MPSNNIIKIKKAVLIFLFCFGIFLFFFILFFLFFILVYIFSLGDATMQTVTLAGIVY